LWATLESIVDETDDPAKHKMIRLKICLEGKAEEAVSQLWFSEEAYKEAKTHWNVDLEEKEDNFRIISKT